MKAMISHLYKHHRVGQIFIKRFFLFVFLSHEFSKNVNRYFLIFKRRKKQKERNRFDISALSRARCFWWVRLWQVHEVHAHHITTLWCNHITLSLHTNPWFIFGSWTIYSYLTYYSHLTGCYCRLYKDKPQDCFYGCQFHCAKVHYGSRRWLASESDRALCKNSENIWQPRYDSAQPPSSLNGFFGSSPLSRLWLIFWWLSISVLVLFNTANGGSPPSGPL